MRTEGSGGVTVTTGPDDDHYGAASDWLSTDPDIDLAGAAEFSIPPREGVWIRLSDYGHGFHDSRGGLTHEFMSVPSEWEARDYLSGVTVGPRAGFELVSDHHEGEVATHVMRIPIHLVCGVDPGPAAASPSSMPAPRERIASFPTMSCPAVVWKERDLIPLAGSFRKVSNVRASRIHDVTYTLTVIVENRLLAGNAFGFRDAGTDNALVSTVPKVLSVSDAVSAGLLEPVEPSGVGSAASPESIAGAKDRVLERLRELRAAPEAEQPPWAERPVDRAFADAQRFVSAWPSVDLPMPDVGLADDGEVNFLWQGPQLHVDLGFFGDGTFSCFARAPGGVRIAVDDVAAELGLPPDLQAILKA